MAKNVMTEVAKLLGVELEEEFKIDGFDRKYKLTKDGLVYLFDNSQEWLNSCWLEELLTGEDQIVKIPKQILDDVEREYLSNVIKPFRNRVIDITKYYHTLGEHIDICLKHHSGVDYGETLVLPFFKKGTMYKGMELDKGYTLEELGL